ncbi:FabD/lysophospholipase-like protein [Cenococcum geophilum 1.58]|uniref:FabD/lysophospholipase-like protein n=1 Tax=Cenococcum geophilum 1.58 TaxID=794803 RepID=A0ACC8EJZ5_9PEZI|nr:FabD/lysophospholipase-like protein [Cenococcum geophilum 1.58]
MQAARYGEMSPVDETRLCLLSLDGGGVRGLSALYILKALMEQLNKERRNNNLPPVKPCEIFDLIGGTSTGGLIAIMLGRLQMNVDECISEYKNIMKEVFENKSGWLPISWTSRIKTQFDSKRLKDAIKGVITRIGASETDLFNNGKPRQCKVFVCATARETSSIIRLRSYSLPGANDIGATICDAALATSAATSFFNAVSIEAGIFVDGALRANNPVDEVEDEASNIWCPQTGDLKPLVKCFISIGTGNPGTRALRDSMLRSFYETLVSITTETEYTERKFISRWRRHYDEKRFFRFNVDQGLHGVGLAEYKEEGIIEAATRQYLDHQAQRFRVRDCVQNLRLASTYTDQGRWKEAEELQVQVLEMSKKRFGVNHSSTLTSMANLASASADRGRWKEAEELQVHVMETRKRMLDADHPSTLTSMANLASTYKDQGRWKEAEELQLHVLETRKRVLGVEHPSTLTSIANLAVAYSNQGRWKEAEELFVQVMEMSKKKLGTYHPDTLSSMTNLAVAYSSQGRWKEAEELQVQVLETRKRMLGADHPSTLTSMANLALTYTDQGRWKDAEELQVQVLEMSKKIFGVNHPSTLISMANLASAYADQGRWKEAEELQVQVLEMSKKIFGVNHPSTLVSMNNLAYTWRRQGRDREALKLMEECVEL